MINWTIEDKRNCGKVILIFNHTVVNNNIRPQWSVIYFFNISTFSVEKEEGKGKSKLAAFLISLFLGELGVDWFYLSGGGAGYIVAGIFKLLTLGNMYTFTFLHISYIYIICKSVYCVVFYFYKIINSHQ